MPVNESVQRAHDELLATKPEGVVHERCNLCLVTGDIRMTDKEVAKVADVTETKFTEEQHFALLESAVARETSTLTARIAELEAAALANMTEAASVASANTELQTRIDVLEAEKSAALAATSDVQAAFDTFKSELADKAEVETRKADRVAAIQAANEGLPEDYFTDERAQRWAEMSDETFDVLVEGLSAVPATKTESEVTQQARETSAFTGGTVIPATTGGSTLGSLFQAVGLTPASN
jgi:hypothetical protein